MTRDKTAAQIRPSIRFRFLNPNIFEDSITFVGINLGFIYRAPPFCFQQNVVIFELLYSKTALFSRRAKKI